MNNEPAAAPAPAAPVAPAAEPAAPVAPVAPVTPPAPAVTPPAPTPEEAAQAQEDKEWDDAAEELFPGLKGAKKKEAKKNEPAKSKEDPAAPETTTETTIDPNETPEQKTEREAKEADDAAKAAEDAEEPDTSARDARVAARQTAQEMGELRTDIREKMFADIPQVLQDAEGDPIRTIDDVQKLINPITQKPFTEEEAGQWLLSAQQRFNQELADMDKRIDQIAETNLDLKDQADNIKYQYGELLLAMPDLQKQLWAEYEKTLEKDPKTNIITKAPVSLERFYEIALQPYAKLALSLENEQAEKTAADEAAKAAEEEKKTKARQDRSDIFGGGNVNTMTDDEKEWDAAATTVFGPRKATK